MAAFERATVGLFLWWSASLALLDDAGRAQTISRFGVAETVERIETGARARGLQVLERTDHAAIAKGEGYRLRPTQSLLVLDAAVGDPVRLVVWQTGSGITAVSIDGRARQNSQAFDPQLPGLLQALAPAAGAVSQLS